MSSATAVSSTAEARTVQEATSTPQIIVASTTPPTTNDGLYDLVVASFPGDPTMVRISKCESRYRQYEKDGSVLRGRVNPKDVGLFQVNEGYHLEAAKKRGIDIYTPTGNIAYAKILRSQNGYRDWRASESCWAL